MKNKQFIKITMSVSLAMAMILQTILPTFAQEETIVDVVARAAWQYNNGKWYYYDENGNMVIGWKYINGAWYCFDGTGAVTYGWKQINEKWYYFDGNAKMVMGWQYINNVWYYFDMHGVMVTGWMQINNKWYWFESNGAMIKGWKQISGIWYYFNEHGIMITGWKQIAGKWYWFESNGTMITGWKQISGKWYWFDSHGVMKTGWLQLGSTWYYLDESGAMVTGTKNIDGKVNYFDNSGRWLYSKSVVAHTHNYKYYKTDTSETFDHVRTNVLVQAYDEPVYETHEWVVCNGCGAKFKTTSEWDAHNKPYMLQHDGSHASYSVKTESTKTGSIHHDAVVEYYNVYRITYKYWYKCEKCDDVILYNTADSTREEKVES